MDIINVLLTSVLIFMARILDVSLGTMRIIFVAKGRRFLAPLLGFFEVMIWLMAISQVMQSSSNPIFFVFYAAGFAAGNFTGIYLENKLALGMLIVRVITSQNETALIKELSDQNYGVTAIDGMGRYGPVKVIFTVIKRRALREVVSIIRRHNPKAFFSIEEAQSASKGIFPAMGQGEGKGGILDFLGVARKGK